MPSLWKKRNQYRPRKHEDSFISSSCSPGKSSLYHSLYFSMFSENTKLFFFLFRFSEFRFFWLNFSMQFLFVLCRVEARQSAGYCAMYDICGARSDGKVLNCPFNIPAVKVTWAESILLLLFSLEKMVMIYCSVCFVAGWFIIFKDTKLVPNHHWQRLLHWDSIRHVTFPSSTGNTQHK